MGNPRKINLKSNLPDLDDLTGYELDQKNRLIYAFRDSSVTKYTYLGNDPHPDIVTYYNINSPSTYSEVEYSSPSTGVPSRSSLYINGELTGVTYAFPNQFDASVYSLNSDGEKIFAKEFFNQPGSLKNKVYAYDSTPGDGIWDAVRTDYFEIYGGGNGNRRFAYSEYQTDVPFGTISELI